MQPNIGMGAAMKCPICGSRNVRLKGGKWKGCFHIPLGRMTTRFKSAYPWIVVGLLWGVALLNYLDRQMLTTMRMVMMGDIRELETAENFGRLMAIFLWIYGLMSPMAGLIADRINRKWLIVGSLGVWSGVTLAMGFTSNFHQLYALRAIMGVSEALYIPAGLSLIADYHRGTTRSLAVGIHMTGLYFGQALGGFGATIARQLSWHKVFHLFGLAGVIYSLVLIVLLHECRGLPDTEKQTVSEKGGFGSVRRSLGMLLGTVSFWVILFYFAAPGFPGGAVRNWMPTFYSERLGIDMSKAGPLSTITLALSMFVGVIFGGVLADRWIQRHLRGRLFTGAIGLGLIIPGLILLGFGQGRTGVLGGTVLFGIGGGMFDANNMPILCQFVSPRHRAAGYGLMNMTGVFAGALITGALGRSTDAGHLGRDMALLAIPVALAIALQLAMLRPRFADKTDDADG